MDKPDVDIQIRIQDYRKDADTSSDIARIDGKDPYAIMGMCTSVLTAVAKKIGVSKEELTDVTVNAINKFYDDPDDTAEVTPLA